LTGVPSAGCRITSTFAGSGKPVAHQAQTPWRLSASCLLIPIPSSWRCCGLIVVAMCSLAHTQNWVCAAASRPTRITPVVVRVDLWHLGSQWVDRFKGDELVVVTA
jgi:hypothetical protein